MRIIKSVTVVAILLVFFSSCSLKQDSKPADEADTTTSGAGKASSSYSEEAPESNPFSDNTVSETSEVQTQPKINSVWDFSDATGSEMPQEVAKAFSEATKNQSITLDPVVCLGMQVVSGFNYAVLCKNTAGDSAYLKVIIIYAPFNAEARISNITDFDISYYTDSHRTYEPGNLAGGWNPLQEYSGFTLPSEAGKLYEKSGAEGKPVAYLGHDNSSPGNYAFICQSEAGLNVVIVSDSGMVRNTQLKAAEFSVY